ncbi:hypothetical protein METBIDRAFT_131201 [Metschnikowia bicuspidata var. bicuspidata NRRL YB-4993]|uniref:Uncharacterized protein n=1 Tax=Metschnikowia bicuspidata var. bicuspidata NRRL YB-4993 TaxID=869754 RepID=A0A1A0HK03_9ASCO|nr:hypothetical protein METBIDRAFT_131201 [Metschnikowia bicuspidata var. bicuspidata NRRL YB-4993]OBA24331.1 hypothetical protein METBIDRAFT_131201 [Metschnikowia bicuspidata var. bicuspidata NRRL YB-4993]
MGKVSGSNPDSSIIFFAHILLSTQYNLELLLSIVQRVLPKKIKIAELMSRSEISAPRGLDI